MVILTGVNVGDGLTTSPQVLYMAFHRVYDIQITLPILGVAFVLVVVLVEVVTVVVVVVAAAALAVVLGVMVVYVNWKPGRVTLPSVLNL